MYVLGIHTYDIPGSVHFYGTLYKVTHPGITIDNVDEYSVDHFADSEEEIKRALMKKEAIELNKTEGFGNYALGVLTNKFTTPKEIIDFVKECILTDEMKKEPFIPLLDGDKISQKYL